MGHHNHRRVRHAANRRIARAALGDIDHRAYWHSGGSSACLRRQLLLLLTLSTLLDNVVPLIVALYRLVRHLTNARAIRRLRRAAVRRVTRGRALDVNRRGEAALLARLADARFEPTIARRRESEADAAVVQQAVLAAGVEADARFVRRLAQIAVQHIGVRVQLKRGAARSGGGRSVGGESGGGSSGIDSRHRLIMLLLLRHLSSWRWRRRLVRVQWHLDERHV